MGWLEWPDVGLPFPGQLGSDCTPADSRLFNQFLLRTDIAKNNRILCCISKWFLSPSSARSSRNFLSPLLSIMKTMSCSRKWISQNCGGPFITRCPRSFQLSDSSMLNLQQFVNNIWAFLRQCCFPWRLPLISAPVARPPCLRLSLSPSWGSSLLRVFPLGIQKESWRFSVCSSFYLLGWRGNC